MWLGFRKVSLAVRVLAAACGLTLYIGLCGLTLNHRKARCYSCTQTLAVPSVQSVVTQPRAPWPCLGANRIRLSSSGSISVGTLFLEKLFSVAQ